jgi:hypothetical protein
MARTLNRRRQLSVKSAPHQRGACTRVRRRIDLSPLHRLTIEITSTLIANRPRAATRMVANMIQSMHPDIDAKLSCSATCAVFEGKPLDDRVRSAHNARCFKPMPARLPTICGSQDKATAPTVAFLASKPDFIHRIAVRSRSPSGPFLFRHYMLRKKTKAVAAPAPDTASHPARAAQAVPAWASWLRGCR